MRPLHAWVASLYMARHRLSAVPFLQDVEGVADVPWLQGALSLQISGRVVPVADALHVTAHVHTKFKLLRN